MVDMIISNAKLLGRAQGMVEALSGCTHEAAVSAVKLAGNDIKKAVLIAMGLTIEQATHALDAHGGNLRGAIGAMR